MINFMLMAIYTIASVGGLLLLKTGLPGLRGALTSSGSWVPLSQVGGGGLLYVISFGLWMAILSRIDLSVAYPIAIGLTFTFLTVSSVLLFGEVLSALRLAGIVLVFLGVVMVAQS